MMLNLPYERVLKIKNRQLFQLPQFHRHFGKTIISDVTHFLNGPNFVTVTSSTFFNGLLLKC